MDRTLEIIALLVAAWPAADFPEPTIRLYQRMLQDVDPELLMMAVQHFITTSTKDWPPTIGQIRDCVSSLVMRAAGILDAYSAWEQVLAQKQAHGIWKPPSLPELSHKAVAAIGGWLSLCKSDNEVSDRARFIEAYTLFLAQVREQHTQLPQVAAMVEGARAKALGNGGPKQ